MFFLKLFAYLMDGIPPCVLRYELDIFLPFDTPVAVTSIIQNGIHLPLRTQLKRQHLIAVKPTYTPLLRGVTDAFIEAARCTAHHNSRSVLILDKRLISHR